jgi:hypothetical protein
VALSIVLEPSGLNQQLNQGTTTGYSVQGGIDWGGAPIQDIISQGSYRLEDIDALFAAGRVQRTVTIPMRVIGSSKDDLAAKLGAISYVLAKASRYAPVDLVVTPNGSTKTSTFKILGGLMDGAYDSLDDIQNRWVGTLSLQALPPIYGAKQTYGTSGSPLLAATAGPTSFTVTIPSGSEGDLLADVTVIFQNTADALGAVSVGVISGNTGWLVGSDVTGWTNGSGGGTRATQSVAKYKGGAAPSYEVATAGVIEEAYTKTFSTTDFPVNTPIRVLLNADDLTATQASRGLNQLRLAVTAGGVTQYGDWVSVPPNAGNGTTTHFTQGLDMGTFLFPPGPSGSVAFSGTTTIAIQAQTTNTVNSAAVALDEVVFLPDASSLVAEWPLSQPAANTPIRIESDLLFNNADGAPQTVLASGSHIRFRGTSRVGIWTSAKPLANTSGDITYSTVKAWVEYTPRYIHLAPV